MTGPCDTGGDGLPLTGERTIPGLAEENYWFRRHEVVYARLADRPAMIPLVPGLLLLVPGSMGLRSLSSMLERDVVTGIDTAFAMLLVGVSLVAGLLMATASVPPRREL